MNKLQNFINLGVTFNTEILDKIKEKYPNGLQSDDRLILQEISDEISYINNELHKNITNYISNYNSKISQALDIAETEGDITLKAEYEKRANILITNLSNIKYAKYESNKKIKNITEMLKEEIDFNKKSINNLYSDVKLLKTMNSINQENYSTINNSLYNYLEEQFNTEDEDKKINNLKGYLNSIYNNFHKFLFYFYKELSKDVINKLNNIKYNKSESINIQQKLFSITEQILSEYNTPIPDAFLGDIFGEHLAKIEEYFQNYNQTILEYLNLDYEKIASGYDISEEYWNNFKSNLDELINSFKMISQNKDKILEFPQELDYIINTLESFINNDLKLIFEDINNYSKNLLTKKILPLYIKTNLNYITLYHKSNNYYLNKNIEQFSQILERDNSKGNNHIKLYNDYFEFYSQNIKDQAQSSYISERLDNFILINESVINRYNSEIESGFNEIKSYRESIYDYFNGINNDLTNREKYQNNLMRARLEIMMSYINLFATNLKETINEKDFSYLFNNNSDLEELGNSYYFVQLNDDINKINLDYYQADFLNFENNFDFQLEENIDKETFLNDHYRTIDMENFDTYYDMMLNLSDDLFKNYTQNKFEEYNDSIYSLIDEYKSILYQYVNGYDYDIISFDIFEDYFNNLTITLENKYESVKNKTKTIKELLWEEYGAYNYSYINKFFYDNISKFIEERNNNFKEALTNNDFQTKIGSTEFSLSEYIFNEWDAYYIIPFNNYEKDTSILMNEIEKYILELEYPIKTQFKNITDEFLIDFQKGVNISDKDRKSLLNTYKNVFKFPNNDTFNRQCWNYRGIFLVDIVKEDEINYDKYLDYLKKKKTIEECEANNETNICPYDREELEEIEFTNQTDIYLECHAQKKIYSHKQSIFETMDDFDLEKLNKIKNKLLDILDECSSFENLITDYFYDRYGLNDNKNFTSENLNLEKLINDTENFINKYIDKFNENFGQIPSLIKDIFDNLYGSE